MELSQQEQEEFIYEIQTGIGARQELFHNNPFLSNFLYEIPADIIKANQHIIRQRFSIEAYGKEISGIYRKILE